MTDFNESAAAPADTGHDSAATVPSPNVGGGAEPSAITDAAPVESSVLDVELPAGMQQFDRSYVDKVRREAAENRTKAREFEERLGAMNTRYAAFEGYDDDDMGIWSEMGSSWKDGDYVGAATRMQQIAVGVLGDPNASSEERAEAAAVLDDPSISAVAQGLTEDQVRAIAREETEVQAAERRQAVAIEDVFATIGEAGYERDSVDAAEVLWYANKVTNGDLEQAIGMKKAKEQSIIDNYVSSVAAGGTPVRLPATGTAGTPAPPAISDLSEARRQADAWLAERQNAG